ncbi:glutamate-5-semialdehyde dehydrogenase [Candidatus Endolissoclinum faulkneri L2]|uniref:Gamma-glutamyl phosphate reductase n=1 Tax=Candidatus Endolissoclinum faulkneri L2 TaxID=1193729 RepID=K7YRN4_9PROT|nr:glutamate-5-semialdehyde dehydrogenase [Candidatus Endolissoclinum faulkneri]AFX99214.1 glutamate-5-semialdehyde dehydrogenase [Candidatus Endolissoclinum faulkneri L2]
MDFAKDFLVNELVDFSENEIEAVMLDIGKRARIAAAFLAHASSEQKDQALRNASTALLKEMPTILNANFRDISIAKENGLKESMIDRLLLTDSRISDMSNGLNSIAELSDPVGLTIKKWTRPNGLYFECLRVPIGVIGVIYESRPNVTADAGGLCLKAGNSVILRCGSESYHSAKAITAAIHQGLISAGLPKDAIQLVPTNDRIAVSKLITMPQYVDVIVPRGGKSLIERVHNESRVPVLAHLSGLCHVYLDAEADLEKAVVITVNAKMRRTSVCNAAEVLLIDRDGASKLLPPVAEALSMAGCVLRGDKNAQAIVGNNMESATEIDWETEYLDAIMSVALVDGVSGAIAHINSHGSHHTDSIVTENKIAAEKFLLEVDSAIVLHNASTQFADGGEFGFGAEIGISTGRIHARGPISAEHLTSFKYLVRGSGQIRH